MESVRLSVSLSVAGTNDAGFLRVRARGTALTRWKPRGGGSMASCLGPRSSAGGGWDPRQSAPRASRRCKSVCLSVSVSVKAILSGAITTCRSNPLIEGQIEGLGSLFFPVSLSLRESDAIDFGCLVCFCVCFSVSSIDWLICVKLSTHACVLCGVSFFDIKKDTPG